MGPEYSNMPLVILQNGEEKKNHQAAGMTGKIIQVISISDVQINPIF